MAYQFPDSGQEVVRQLNNLNGVNLGENDVTTETTATTVKVTGINKYHNSVTVNNPKRDFNELFPQGIILRVSGLATMSGSDALSLAAEKCGFTFDRDIFTDESLATTWEISWNVHTSQFALVVKEDNPDWTGTLYISLYDELPVLLVPLDIPVHLSVRGQIPNSLLLSHIPAQASVAFSWRTRTIVTLPERTGFYLFN